MRLLFLLLLLFISEATYAQRITRERLIDRSSNRPYLGFVYTPTGMLLVNHSSSHPSPATCASYFQLVSRQLDSLSSGPALPNTEWQVQATVLAPAGGYAVATTAVSPNWPAERTDLAFYRYSNPLALPRLTTIQDLDGGSNDYSTDLLPASDGYFISAQVTGRSVRNRFKLIKTDTTGRIRWQKNFGVSINDFIVGMRYTTDGNIVLAGETGYPVHLRMLLVNQAGDSLANLSYAYPRPLGPNTTMRAPAAVGGRLLALRGGGFAMLAQLDTTGNSYPLVLKVNRRLQPQWQYTHKAQPLFGLSRRMYAAGSCELQDSSVLVLVSNTNGSPQNNPFYLLRLDGATGQLRNTYPLLSNLCSQFHATNLLADGDSALFVIGTCLNATYAAHISLRGLPALVLATAPVGRAAALRLELNEVYPNPADGAATVSYRCPAGLTGEGTIRLLDILGREVWRSAVPASRNGTANIPTVAVAEGLYWCQLHWPGQVPVTRRLLVQH